jgi:undecaprenyl-diphosphatase
MILNIFKIIIISIFGSIYQSIGIGVDSYKYLVNIFMKIDNLSINFGNALFVTIQIGIVLSILLLFYNRIWPFKKIRIDDENKIGINISRVKLLFKIVMSIIVYVLVKQIYGDVIIKFLDAKIVNIVLLIILGGLIIVLQMNKKENKINSLYEISWKEVFIIASFNVIIGSIFHDVSLLSIMIIIGLCFCMAKNIIFEYGLYMLLFSYIINFLLNISLFYGFNLNEWILLSISVIFSFISSVLIIRGFMDFLQKGNYRFIGIFKVIIALYYLILIFLKLI